jgi:hypothetical protein
MSRKITNPKRTRGRPAIGIGTLIGLRWREPELEAIDAWRREQAEPLTRGQAIRDLVRSALAIPRTRRGHSAASLGAKHRPSGKQSGPTIASRLAAEQIDKISDGSAPPEARQARKRHLIKGPKEFRDVRIDMPKSK